MDALKRLTEYLRQEVILHATYPDLQNRLGLVLAFCGDYKEAILHYENALKTNPLYTTCLTNYAFAQAAAGKNQEGLRTIKRVIIGSPGDCAVLTAHGQYQLAYGEPQEAIDSFEKALHLRPDLRSAHHNLAVSLLFLPSPTLRRVEKLFHHAGRGEGFRKYYKEINLFESGKLILSEKVGQALKNPLIQNPNYIRIHVDLANLVASEGDYEGAKKEFSLALSLAPESAEVENAFGEVESRKGNRASAIAHFKKAVSFDRRHVMAHANLAFIYGEKGQLRNALTEMRAAVELAPRYADLRYQLGTLLIEFEKFDEAIENFKAAVSLNPNYTFAYYRLASSLYHAGKFNDAILIYRRILPAEVELPDIHRQLAVCYLKTGRINEAIRECKVGCPDEKRRALFHLYLAQANYAKGDKKKAHAELRNYFKLKKSTEGQKEARRLLAELAHKSG
jgi:tetratricopeptide (TPR) repeat protein